MSNAIQTSLSGLIASSVRANAAASNIVNSQVTSSLKGSASLRGPFQTGYTPIQVQQTTTRLGGTHANVVPVSPSSLAIYDPRSPLANEQGAVGIPNVSLPAEIAELRKASHAYQANAKALKTLDDTFKTLLKI